MPTVLLLHDDPEVRATAARALTAEGYTVLQPADGGGALAAAGREPVDAVVVDLVHRAGGAAAALPLLRQLRPGVGVVFTWSGQQAPAAVERFLAPGAAVVPCPFTPSALVAAVGRSLRAHG